MIRSLLITGVLFISLAMAVSAEEPTKNALARPKVSVELRWVERNYKKGITEEDGFQSSCDPDSIVYQHKKPALVLTAKDVKEVSLTKHHFRDSDLATHFTVKFTLNKDSRERLIEAAGEEDSRELTVVLNGKCWGVRRYEKGPKNIITSDSTRAENFNPDVGFFSSEAEAQRLIDAFKN